MVQAVRRRFRLFFRTCLLPRIGAAKPDSAYFLHILEVLALDANDALVLDDHEVNVAAAREAGLHEVTFKGEDGASVLWQTLAEFGIAVS